MADTQWHINGDFMLACNCDFGCPCNFNARPSEGNCQGAIGFYVEEGAYDGVALDDSTVMLAAKWPGAIHEGNGVAACFIDESASPEQREALWTIVSGQAGGMPWEIFAATFSHVAEPQYVKIDLRRAGQDSEVSIDGRIKISFQPIRNPVTKVEAYPKVVLPQGFVFKEGDQYALKEFWVNAGPELTFAHPGKCAEYAKVQWTGP